MISSDMTLLSRILNGDMIWFAIGGGSALAGWWLARLFPRRWMQIVGGLLLACLFVWLAHQGYEIFHEWYTTPLGPGLELSR